LRGGPDHRPGSTQEATVTTIARPEPGPAERKLAGHDSRGAPYTVPPAGVTYADALAIARSAHPSRVLANTAVYRYGRFTENADHTVDVHMMGSHIARFWPGTVQLWWRGHVTTSSTEALSNLVTGGYFFADGRVVCFRDYAASEAARPTTDGGHHFYRAGKDGQS
jgi:hypothetical protein